MTTRRSFLKALAGITALPGLGLGCSGADHGGKTAAWPGPDDPAFWPKLRRQFLMPPDEAFFNSGTLGASPRVVVDAVTDHMREAARTIAHWDYKPDHPTWFTGYYPENETRKKLAALVNASTSEIALTQNATMGMNLMAHGLDLKRGDEVLSTDQEHPGGRCAWELRAKRHGIVWKPLPIPIPPGSPEQVVNIFRNAITKNTRVIALAHITSAYGMVMPVKQICARARDRGILTVIDGAQAVGQVPVDVKDLGCDAYFSSPHKWLMAPAGCGFLYVRDEVGDRVWPTLASSAWNNYEDDGFRLQQRGTGNLSLLRGLNAAIDFHNRIGPRRVTGRIKELGDILRAGLQNTKGVTIVSPVHPEMCAGMTTYSVDGIEPVEAMDILWERRKLRPRAIANVGLRQSTHIHNSEEEIEATLEEIGRLAS